MNVEQLENSRVCVSGRHLKSVRVKELRSTVTSFESLKVTSSESGQGRNTSGKEEPANMNQI